MSPGASHAISSTIARTCNVVPTPIFTSIQYLNFKILRDATLPLGPFTLLVGPNGSGKSTALQALQLAAQRGGFSYSRLQTLGSNQAPQMFLTGETERLHVTFDINGSIDFREASPSFANALTASRFFAFDPATLGWPYGLQPNVELGPNGQNLVVVIDHLRDRDPERFEKLNVDLSRWLPEFDRILFDTPAQGTREILLRVAGSTHRIRASELSHGTLFALALLCLANLSELPPFVAIEEPDRGIHPRMLRRIQDALYRLTSPQEYGDSRAPVQVVATTHSPFLLDLYRDHPEQIVIAERKPDGGHFSRLSDRKDIDRLLGDASLGDLWYSGIFGGVPAES
jgi:predicted ATPase